MQGNGTSPFFSRAPGWMYFGGRDVETSDYRGDCTLRLRSRCNSAHAAIVTQGTVSLSENTASAVIGRPPHSNERWGVNRRAHRRAYRHGYYGYGYGGYGYGYNRPGRYGYGTYQPSYYGTGYGTYRPSYGYAYQPYGYQPW